MMAAKSSDETKRGDLPVGPADDRNTRRSKTHTPNEFPLFFGSCSTKRQTNNQQPTQSSSRSQFVSGIMLRYTVNFAAAAESDNWGGDNSWFPPVLAGQTDRVVTIFYYLPPFRCRRRSRRQNGLIHDASNNIRSIIRRPPSKNGRGTRTWTIDYTIPPKCGSDDPTASWWLFLRAFGLVIGLDCIIYILVSVGPQSISTTVCVMTNVIFGFFIWIVAGSFVRFFIDLVTRLLSCPRPPWGVSGRWLRP
jgi:hypothetical protein